MPVSRAQAGQCIFCAWRQFTRTQRPKTIRRQHASLSTATRIAHGTNGEDDSPVRLIRSRLPERDWIPRHELRPFKRLNVDGPAEPQSRRRDRPDLDWSKFKGIILRRLEALEPTLRTSPVFKQPGVQQQQIDKALTQFRWYLRENIGEKFRQTQDTIDLRRRLWRAFEDGGDKSLDNELRYALYNHFLGRNFTATDINNQKSLADLRYPTEWHPLARRYQRTIHAHIGPTNSGKTYHALKRLEQAKSGVYAGPLRLLAHEVYTRLNAKGATCALVTGEEQRLPVEWAEAKNKIVSCTVEMTSLSTEYDVAVIDEIQMLGSLDRGFAWSNAFMGLCCQELHVCGEERALPIIRELAAAMGDKLVVHKYERLTRLQMDDGSLNNSFKKLRKGDCVVTFSVMNIHALRAEIEKKTGKKVAVVYGSLPPETRAQQAALFNEPDNDYDYLVASDAVGMGLNLSIKRVIFETVHKFDSDKIRTLTVSEIRQIAGRAGRYRSAAQAIKQSQLEQEANSNGQLESTSADSITIPEHDKSQPEPPTAKVADASPYSYSPARFDEDTVGLVTTIDPMDFGIVKKALNREPPPLTFAAIQPPPTIIQRFASYFPPGTPFSYILFRLKEIAETSSRYVIYHKPDDIVMADLIHDVENLSTEDRLIFVNAPVGFGKDTASPLAQLVVELAECCGRQRGGDFLSIKTLDLGLLDRPTEGTKARLKQLELLHKGIVLYLWLSFRFPGVFTQRPLANHTKELVEREIEETLRLMSFMSSQQRRKKMWERSQLEKEILAMIGEGEDATEVKAGVAGVEQDMQTPGDNILCDAGEDNNEAQLAEIDEKMPEDDEGEYPEDMDREVVGPEVNNMNGDGKDNV